MTRTLGLAGLTAALLASACSPPTPPAAIATASPAPLIPRSHLFSNPERSAAQISPDGAHLSWLAPNNGVMNVWVAPAGDLAAAKALTAEIDRPIGQHVWSEDGKYVLYTKDKGGDENFKVFAVDVASGVAKSFAPDKPARTDILYTSPTKPNIVLVEVNDRDPQWFDVWALDLATGKKSLVYKNVDQIGQFTFDHNLELRVGFRANPGGGGEFLTRKGGKWTTLEKVPAEDGLTTAVIGMNGANDTVYMIDSVGRNTAMLASINLSTGAKKTIAEDAKADVGGFIVDPKTFELLAWTAPYLRQEWTALNPETGKDIAFLKSKLDGDFDIVSQTADNKTWVVAVNSAAASPAWYRYDRAEQKLAKLFDARPVLAGDKLARMTPVEIKSRDGMTLPSYLTLPVEADANNDGVADKPVPMLLWVHGGPWGRDFYGYSGYVQWMANRGYAVLQVNYRASTGFGKALLNAGNKEWAGKMHDDLIDAVKWAVDSKVTTADNVAIGGGSYGGYATLAGVTFTPDAFACGVDIVGPSNLNTLLASIPPYWKAQFEDLALRVGDPRTEEGKKLLAERSPLTRAAAIKKPLLIGQGANDPRVKQAEADQIVAAMQEHKIPVTYVLYPDEGHGFRRPENNMSFNAITESFLAKCLGGRSEPIGDSFKGSSLVVKTGAENVAGLSEALAPK